MFDYECSRRVVQSLAEADRLTLTAVVCKIDGGNSRVKHLEWSFIFDFVRESCERTNALDTREVRIVNEHSVFLVSL